MVKKPCYSRRFTVTYDFAPLFRTAIGFDRLARLATTAQEAAAATSYPPYNIEKTGEDSYRLTMAVAGFGREDIEITVQDSTLVVAGRVNAEPKGGEVLYRGIAGRAFERRFVLADHIVVEGADLENGLLHVGLKRVVPEALKPRRIAIGDAPAQKLVANDAAQGSAQAA
jgi:molecular chaperone IbpA